MTGTSRKLGALALLFALATPGALAQDIQSMFDEGVDLLSRGKDDEALQAFQRVLAADPSHEQAYELFKSTEHDVWLEILTRQGEFELVAKRLMGLARMGRVEKRNDADAIRVLVSQLGTEDLIALLGAWGSDPGGPPDFDGDGNVGAADLIELLGSWGPCS